MRGAARVLCGALIAISFLDVVGAASAVAATAPPRPDIVVTAPRFLRLTIREGAATGSRRFRVDLRRADLGDPVAGAASVRLSASAGNCPAGTLLAAPDFGALAAGEQADVVELLAGGFARASVTLTVTASEVSSFNPGTAARCSIEISTNIIDPSDAIDRRPTNDRASITVEIIDEGDRASFAIVDDLSLVARPLRAAFLPQPGAGMSASLIVNLRNKALNERTLTLSGEDGSCPAGTLASLDLDPRQAGAQTSAVVAAGKSLNAKATLLLAPPREATRDGLSPERCQLSLSLDGGGADGDATNDTATVVVDRATLDSTGGAGCPAYAASSTTSGNAPAALLELSGLAASTRHAGIYWSHNDSGNPFALHALREDGTIAATFPLSGGSSVDPEDIALGPCSAGASTTCIYLADIGDNSKTRSSVRLFRIVEPAMLDGSTLPVETLSFVYEDGPRDAEALLIEPVTARPFIVSKITTALGQLYRIDDLGEVGGGTARRISTLNSTPVASLVTGGDVHPSGERVLLRTYGRVFEYLAPGADSLEEVFAVAPIERTTGSQPQSEAIAYTADGLGYLIGSEQRAALLRVDCD